MQKNIRGNDIIRLKYYSVINKLKVKLGVFSIEIHNDSSYDTKYELNRNILYRAFSNLEHGMMKTIIQY